MNRIVTPSIMMGSKSLITSEVTSCIFQASVLHCITHKKKSFSVFLGFCQKKNQVLHEIDIKVDKDDK